MPEPLTISTRRPAGGQWVDPGQFPDRSTFADHIGRAINDLGVTHVRVGEVGRTMLGLDLLPNVTTERVGVIWTFDPDLDGPSSVGHFPAGPWEFDRGVTDVFDDMLRRSIPQLDVMRAGVVEAATRIVLNPEARVADVGCSRGRQLDALLAARPGWRAIGWDRSIPMVEAARAQLAAHGDRATVELRDVVTDGLPLGERYDVVLLVLTLQFIQPSLRRILLRDLRSRVHRGGCIVLVEKVDAGPEFIDAYHALKRRNGYTDSEIQAKAESLRGVLVPWSARANEDTLRETGWGEPECFWRWFNFAGWVARAQ